MPMGTRNNLARDITVPRQPGRLSYFSDDLPRHSPGTRASLTKSKEPRMDEYIWAAAWRTAVRIFGRQDYG